MTKRLLIIAHAPSNNTEALAQALEQGASEAENLIVDRRSPFDTEPAHILQADGIILATTENLGYMSGALKDCFDRCYYPCLEHTQGRPYALCVRAGHDGTGTVRGVTTIVTGLRWRAVSEPTVSRGPWQASFPDDWREIGQAMGIGVSEGMF